jgi:hypothetical protein
MIATTLSELDSTKKLPQKPSTNSAFVGSNMQALEDALMRIAH